MGKIPVQDLARMMGIPHQDLIFKLKSIGVRVEGDDAQIETETLQAILQGKKLPHPKEVILRDDETGAAIPARPRRPDLPPSRPAPPSLLRTQRPRTMIQRVEPRIKSLPVSERPPAPKVEPVVAPPPPPPAAPPPPVATTTPSVGTRTAPHPPAIPPTRRPGPIDPSGEIRRIDPPERPNLRRLEPPRDGAAKPAGPAEPAGGADRKVRSLKRGTVSKDPGLQSSSNLVLPGSGRPGAQRRRRPDRRGHDREPVPTPKLEFKEAAPEGPVMISEGMTVREFAEKLGVKSKDLIAALFRRGQMANINHVLDAHLAEEVAKDLGVETLIVSFEQEVQLQRETQKEGASTGTEPRAPVVTIMGHVDHGKTSLLDAIRSSKVTESEFGGITQHIGAYEVNQQGRKIVFLDTPGHEAFTMMRARGARVTDIVVLVVAADDGVMPQTIEAIDHARAAKVPIVVAINKIDKPNANPDRVKKELADRELLVEEWGGQTVAVAISALKRQGIDELLEMILLQADVLELKATPEIPAQGTVLEARKEAGRGTVATVLVLDGTLKVGDVFVAGRTWGRARAMTNDHGQRVDVVGPATPVELTGFSDVPAAGDPFQVIAEEAKARSIAEFRRTEQRQRVLTSGAGKLTLEQLFNRIETGEIKELPVVVKADVQGSVEVLRDTLEKLSTEKVKVRVISASVGAISTNDVLLASASSAIVIGFNVRPERNAAELAEKEEVDVRLHTIIYEIVDELRKAMVGLLEPTFKEVHLGRAEVRDTFKVPKVGTIAGCHVIDGVIKRSAAIRLLRDNVVVHEGKISSLRRFKDDAAEVRMGFDCGIGIDRFQDVKPGDVIEAYTRETVAATL